jgi:hypothetical protein
MDGYQYIYCLPLADGRIRSQGNYCLPAAGVWHSQNKVVKCAAYGVAQGRGWRYGWMGGWRNGWMGGWRNRWIYGGCIGLALL